MRVCACFLLVGIFAHSHSSTPNTPRDNKRSVNLALETVLEFNEKDKASDIKFLDNVQDFITKVKTVIGKNNNDKTGFRRDFKAPAVDTFTGFLQEAVNILNTYDNATFVEFFEILDKEIRKYHYRGCKFYELTENNEMRKLIAAKLDSVRRTPAVDIKTNINTLSETLRNHNYDRQIKEIFDYINSLYRQDARGKFQKVLTELELHGKSNSQSDARLDDIVKNGVRSIIFDHYTNLNTNVRRDVKQKMETFWKKIYKYTPNASISDNIDIEVKKSKPVSRKHTANGEIKQSDRKNKGTKRDDVKHDNKRKKHTRKDTIGGSDKVQKKGKVVPSSPHTSATVQKSTKNESQEQSNSLSSDSLEFYHQPEKDTLENKPSKSEKISKKTLTNSRKKPEKIEAVNPTPRIPTHNTVSNIWIEESTGRLPKEVLDKLSIKARGHNTTKAVSKHAPAHNKKYNKGRKSWHGKMYEPKHVAKHMTKHRSKHSYESRRDPAQKTSENKKLDTDKSSKLFNSKLHQYKKSMAPMRADSSNTDQSSPHDGKTQKFLDVLDVLKITEKSGKAIKPIRGTHAATKKLAGNSKTKRVKYDTVRHMKTTQRTLVDSKPQKQLSKNSKKISRKSGTQLAKSFEHPSSSSEGMTVEQMETKNEKTSEYQSQQKVTSLEKDLYVIRKIKNLEKEIEKVKNKINDKAEVKLSEPTESKEKRNFPENKTRSDVNNDPKIDKLETAGTVGNKTKLNNINKDVEKVASKYYDVNDNSENDERNNVDEPNKIKQELFKGEPRPLIDRSIIDSVLRQGNLERTAGTAYIKNGSVIDNTYVQNLVSKYKKMMKDLEKGKITTNVNSDVEKSKKNISEFAMTETAKTTKEALIDSVTGKDSKNTSQGKNSKTFFRSEIDLSPNHFMESKDKSKVTRISDYQKDITKTEKDSKYNETKFNTDEDKSKPKTKQVSDFESVRDRSLNMTKTTHEKEIFNKSVAVSDLKNNEKDEKSETIFRSDVNLISNDLKDKRIEDINGKSKNNEIKGNVEKAKSTINVNTDVVKETELQRSTALNKIKRKLAKGKPRPLVESFTIPGVEPLKIPGVEDNTVIKVKNTYIDNIASNYKKFMAKFEKKKKSKKVNNNNLREGKAYVQQKNELPVRKLVTISAQDAERVFKQKRDKLLTMTKNKSKKPLKVSELNSKVNNFKQGVNPDISLRPDVNEAPRDVQDRTEKTKVIETTDGKTATIETYVNSDTKEKSLGNERLDSQNKAVTKEQSPIVKEDKKTEVTPNTGGVTPEAKQEGTSLMKHRAVDDALKGSEAENREVELTSTLTTIAESTTKDASTVAETNPTTLELSTIEVVLSG